MNVSLCFSWNSREGPSKSVRRLLGTPSFSMSIFSKELRADLTRTKIDACVSCQKLCVLFGSLEESLADSLLSVHTDSLRRETAR